MRGPIELRVHRALARHLGIDPRRVAPSDRLGEDWGLDALDLALIALALEEGEAMAYPMGDLQTLHTVADLVSLTRAWLLAARGVVAARRGPSVAAIRPPRRRRTRCWRGARSLPGGLSTRPEDGPPLPLPRDHRRLH